MTNLDIQKKTIDLWIEQYSNSGLPENKARFEKLMGYLKEEGEVENDNLTLDNSEAFTRLDEILKKTQK